VTVLIVDRALLRVGQHLIGFLALLELVLGFVIVRIAVGVIFHRQAAIRFLDLDLGRGPRDVEHLVVIPLGHSLYLSGPDKAGPTGDQHLWVRRKQA
jgi:hypothetical protein